MKIKISKKRLTKNKLYEIINTGDDIYGHLEEAAYASDHTPQRRTIRLYFKKRGDKS